MAIIFPIVIMFLFCAIYAGAYIWMRRPKFGESEHVQKETIVSMATDIDPRFDQGSNVKSSMDSKNL
jgi:hypothetical protein